MIKLGIALSFWMGVAQAGSPVFLDRSSALPVVHEYIGGWEHFVGGGVAIFDCDGDALPDLYVAGGKNPARLLRNSTPFGGDISFRLGDAPGLTGVIGAYPLDIDGDQKLDIFVLRNGPNAVLKGDGDCGFTDATKTLGIDPGNHWTTAFSATWEADQILPTLAIGNYVDAGDPEGPFGSCDRNFLIRPSGGRFARPVPLDPGFCPLSILFSDWQRTGKVMLRLSNDRHYYVKGGYEQMWRLSPLEELDGTDGWDRLQLWGMGIASQDISGDGLPEVMLTSMGDQVLMANDGDGFSIVPYETGTFAQRPHIGDEGRPSTGWHAEFGDMDNDGFTDLFIAKGNVDQMPGLAIKDPNNLLMQQPDGTFVEAAAEAGIATTDRSRGAGLADLNLDGRLDIVVVNRRAPLEIWQNVSEVTGNWISLRLRQEGPNSNAIGAFVEVRTDAGTQTKELTVGGGHASGSLVPAHFGIGEHQSAKVRVIWPDQSETSWMKVTANQTIDLYSEN